MILGMRAPLIATSAADNHHHPLGRNKYRSEIKPFLPVAKALSALAIIFNHSSNP
jgi:hypothetical protein